jgi:hypothetical protein
MKNAQQKKASLIRVFMLETRKNNGEVSKILEKCQTCKCYCFVNKYHEVIFSSPEHMLRVSY